MTTTDSIREAVARAIRGFVADNLDRADELSASQFIFNRNDLIADRVLEALEADGMVVVPREAQEARRPPAPTLLLEAEQDRHADTAKARVGFARRTGRHDAREEG